MPGNDLEYFDTPGQEFPSPVKPLETMERLDLKYDEERDRNDGADDIILLFCVCLKRRIFALQMTHRSGNVR